MSLGAVRGRVSDACGSKARKRAKERRRPGRVTYVGGWQDDRTNKRYAESIDVRSLEKMNLWDMIREPDTLSRFEVDLEISSSLTIRRQRRPARGFAAVAARCASMVTFLRGRRKPSGCGRSTARGAGKKRGCGIPPPSILRGLSCEFLKSHMLLVDTIPYCLADD